MNPPGNTFREAAEKLGVSFSTIKRYVASRTIGVIEISTQKKFITDAEIERVKQRGTIRAII